MEASWELKAKIEALLVASDRAVSLQALALCLETSEEAVAAALVEFEADLLAADRGIQVRHRPQGIRLETKAQYSELIGRLIPERRPKPLTSQALETLAVIALKQPVSTRALRAIRGVESEGTVQTLRTRKLIARDARLGPHREKLWRTTQGFLDMFGLANLEELYKAGRTEEVFASVYGTDPDEKSYDGLVIEVEGKPMRIKAL